MRKRKIGLVLIALCMLCAMSATALAATKEVQTPFHFILQAGGDKDKSDPAQKLDYANYARIEFGAFSNPTNKPLYFRLRTSGTDEPASNLYEVDAPSTHRPVYWSGYGINGRFYQFNIQTDSSSTGMSAITRGIWVP